jgi:MarR family transcriptional regulator for hemolysin
MLRFDYKESILHWVIATSHLMQRVFNDELAPHGVTYRQAEVLGWLALEGGELSQAELARRMQVAAPTLGGIVDRMERDGWIARRTCPADRRKILLSPTRQVEPVWASILEVGQRLRAQATRGLSAEQVRLLLEGLAVVHENLRKLDVGSEGAPPGGRSLR